MADFCCHGFQLAYRALELDAPTRIEATGDDLGHESYPTRCTVTFDFAAKGKRGPVKLVFYSGDNHLPPDNITKGPVGSTGCLIVGSEGTLSAGLWNTDCNIRLKGASDFREPINPRSPRSRRLNPGSIPKCSSGIRNGRPKENVRVGAK